MTEQEILELYHRVAVAVGHANAPALTKIIVNSKDHNGTK